MGMNILKSFYLNCQNKLYYLAKKAFYNLNNKQCESSYIILLSCNLNIVELNKVLNNIMDDDCYIVDNEQLSKNNLTVPTTAPNATAATATTSRYNNTSSSNGLSSVRTSRRQVQRNKESTSVNLTNRHSSSPVSVINRTNEPNFVLNPFSISNFINYHSFYQSRALALRNVAPPSFDEQRYNYSRQRFRNASLFSEQYTDAFNNDPQRNASSNALKTLEEKEKELISDLRTWIPVNENPGPERGVKFTLMSYNVLAQDLLVEHQYLYRKHQPRALLWENRWKNLYQEILENDPDIICLQEVQEDHLKNHYSQFLNKGYAHLFKKKTGMRSDGCAIYYKKSVFKLLEHTTVEYNQQHPVLDRDNVAIVAKFAPINNTNSEFLVATTHLLYNPRREDVRLAQTQVLLSEIDRIAYKGKKNVPYTPIIITGDFNTEPDSAVYRLIVNGNLKYDSLTNRTLKETNSSTSLAGKVLIPSLLRITDNCQHMDLVNNRLSGENLTRAQELQLIQIRHNKRQTVKGKEPEDKSLFSTGVLTHDLKLQSVYLHKSFNDTEGTTYQDKWITVDYIFYSGTFNKDLKKVSDGKLKLISRYSIPTTTELSSKVRHIPNFALGSDHLALLAKFKLDY